LPKKRVKKFNFWRFFIFVLALVFFAGSGAALVMAGISIKDMPSWDEGKLFAGSASVYYDQKGEEVIARVGEENRTPVVLKDIPLHVQQAFIAIEDVRFYQHHGIDFRGIARAAWYNLQGRSIQQGASTITQQLVKLTFLSPERTPKRKIQEIILSLMVEHRYSKDEILQMYLNKIYFGNGAYGIQTAAQTYFGKNVKDLTLSEAAFLAGLPRAPNIYSQEDEAVARRDVVLDTMAKYEYITGEQADDAKKEPLVFKKIRQGSLYRYPYFVDYVTGHLISRYGADMVYKGGLKVCTTIDTKIQEAAEAAFANNKNFPASVRDGKGVLQPEAAMVFLDPQTGYLKAMVGGREHTGQLQFNRAVDAPRQPGSAFKPIISYAPAIELKGMAPASVIDDVPVKYGSYSPPNYDNVYRGLITMRTALTNSINVAAVRILMDHVGISNAINFANSLGFSLNPKNCGPSIALGGLYHGVTTTQMAAAYGAFANGGVYLPPVAILKVESADGKILEEYQPKPTQVMKSSTAYLITSMLKDVVEKGTGTNARLGRPAAGKTGTTDEGKDIWFVGYTPDLVGAVWIGYDQPKAMRYEFGGRYPALLWKQVMSQALKDSPPRDFIRPANIVPATIDDKSGLLPGPNTPPDDIVTDLFAEGTVPTQTDNTHVLVETCAVTGLLANDYCPERVAKIMVKLPYTVPEYVKDYKTRAPNKICNLHNTETQTRIDTSGTSGQSSELIIPAKRPATGRSDTSNKSETLNSDKRNLGFRGEFLLPLKLRSRYP